MMPLKGFKTIDKEELAKKMKMISQLARGVNRDTEFVSHPTSGRRKLSDTGERKGERKREGEGIKELKNHALQRKVGGTKTYNWME